MGDVAGKRVLCLAASGGQQAVAFALLGAAPTVFDLSDVMLERDRAAAAHYKVAIGIEQGDMRDLSRFDTDAFDLVYQAYSINFVPDVRPVLKKWRDTAPRPWSAPSAGRMPTHADYRPCWHRPHWERARPLG